MIINADLHIHSRYSGATSQKMSIILDELNRIFNMTHQPEEVILNYEFSPDEDWED